MIDKLQQFIAKLNGWRIDRDKRFGYQCNDLTREWLTFLWLTQYKALGDNGVKLIALNPTYYLPNPLKRIKNNPKDPNQTPKSGNIIIFSQPSATGHIAIVVWATTWVNSITIFEQNAGTGSMSWKWSDACRISKKTYKNVLWRITR
jgi:hypothetical protein